MPSICVARDEARAFVSGSVAVGCDHANMLAGVKVPVLLTHHFRTVEPASGTLMGALSNLQAERVQELIRAAGQTVDYRSFPHIGHSMHGQDPKLFVETVADWAGSIVG